MERLWEVEEVCGVELALEPAWPRPILPGRNYLSKTIMQLQPRLPALLLSLGLISCGGGEESPDSAAPANSGTTTSSTTTAQSEEKPAAKPWDPAQGTTRVHGVTRFLGEAPARETFTVDTFPGCHEPGADPVLDESYIVGSQGELQNVFVYVSKGLDEWTFTPPEESLSLVQKGCVYAPHVLGIQVGQTLLIENGDQTVHNVRMTCKRNRAFNQTQVANQEAMEVVFRTKEVLISVKCDMHSWMSSHIGVVDHPFFSVSAADGTFDLGQLPPGDYTITAHHEKAGKISVDLTVEAGKPLTHEFQFGT